MFFVVQAEDGIRDAQESRGLGDVYKRQGVGGWQGFGPSAPFFFGSALALIAAVMFIFWKPQPAAELA